MDEVVIDCIQPRMLASFWAAGLGGDVYERDPDWFYILPPHWTQLSFQRVPERKSGENRLHIDVAVTDLADAIEGARQLGAQLVGTVQHTPVWTESPRRSLGRAPAGRSQGDREPFEVQDRFAAARRSGSDVEYQCRSTTLATVSDART